MLFNRTNKIIEQMDLHLDAVLACYSNYMTGMEKIYELQREPKFSFETCLPMVDEIKELEEKADEYRHQVIRKLLEGGLLVDSRKTTMRILEGIDMIADMTDDIIRMIVFEKIYLSEDELKPILQMNKVTFEQLKLLVIVVKDSVSQYDMELMIRRIERIELLESEVDHIEDKCVKALFESDRGLAEKLHFKEVLRQVAAMSDLIEDLSDEVEIILATRRI